jgi:hypothetical protein
MDALRSAFKASPSGIKNSARLETGVGFLGWITAGDLLQIQVFVQVFVAPDWARGWDSSVANRKRTPNCLTSSCKLPVATVAGGIQALNTFAACHR